MENGELTRVSLDEIRIDGGTQARTGINLDVVEEYAAGPTLDRCPPVTVFYDGNDNWLADGFHRYHAARQRGDNEIRCEIIKGTQREALLFAVGANQDHGVRRTRADVRKCILALLNDDEWAQRSDNWISEKVGCHQTTVSKYRKEHMENISSGSGATVGRDGKKRKRPKRRIKNAQAPIESTAPISAEVDSLIGKLSRAIDSMPRTTVSLTQAFTTHFLTT